MILYKDLPCAEYENINRDLMAWVESQNIEFTDFWNPVEIKNLIKSVPSFWRWLKQSNLLISSAAITYGTTINCCGPHIDTPPARFKLSWPIKNTKGSWNRWFQLKDPKQTHTVNHWGGKMFHEPESLLEITRREVTGPSLIDAGVIHDVWFDTSDPIWPRIGLQCQLLNEPTAL